VRQGLIMIYKFIRHLTLLTLTSVLIACAGASETAVPGLTTEPAVATELDTAVPSKPNNLGTASGSPSSSSVQLVWNASTDNVAVAGYRVVRDNIVISTTTNTTYTDTTVTSGAIYEYTVIAFDAANNTTSSNTLSVNTDSPTGVATVSWTPPTYNTNNSLLTDLSGYKIYYGTSPDTLTNSISINGTGITSYVINNLDTNVTYYFSITAINSIDVESDFSTIISKYISS